MPIIFISLSDTYVEKIKLHGYEAHNMLIENYIPKQNKKTYYISPANSLCFMDGGIDYSLSRIIFPDIEDKVKFIVKQLDYQNKLGKPYLPIGSSIILSNAKRGLIVSPTMLLPQNVSNTQNAYYATMSVLYNLLINNKQKLEDIDIIFTSFCCGYGQMDEEESIKQILRGINDYPNYKPNIINNNIIINEPNLQEQPKYYQNTEFFNIDPKEIILSNY